MSFFNRIKNNWIIVISLIVNVLLLGIIVNYYYSEKKVDYVEEDINNPSESIALQDGNENEVVVEVKGAVKKAGVYRLKSDSIINDLINEAGGFNKDAYTNNINLSRKITNEMVVYVFTKKEYNNQKKSNIKVIEKVVYEDKACECKSADISNCVDNNQSEIISSNIDTIYTDNTDNSEDTNDLISINTATVEQLVNLPGIGTSKANDIVNYRNNNGLFKSIEEIKNVSGIGNALYEKIKELITI